VGEKGVKKKRIMKTENLGKKKIDGKKGKKKKGKRNPLKASPARKGEPRKPVKNRGNCAQRSDNLRKRQAKNGACGAEGIQQDIDQ